MEAKQGPEVILQMLQGHQVSGIVTAAIQLKVFGPLASSPRSADAVAAEIRANPRGVRILLDALTVLGLLKREGGQYRLAPVSAEYLVPGKQTYLGDLTGLFASETMWRGYEKFADAVRNGGTVMAEHAETPQNRFWETFARSTGPMAFPDAGALEATLAGWIREKTRVRVLDIAAGSGIYGFTLARHPNVELTSLDWPNVLVETRQWAKRLGADEKRVKYIEGNVFEVDLAGPYDLVVMSHIYHHFDDETCAKLTKRVAGALAPGGRVAIHDFIADPSLANPAAALFSTIMLLWTKHGEAFTEADYRRWLEGAGLSWLATHPSSGKATSFVIGEKR